MQQEPIDNYREGLCRIARPDYSQDTILETVYIDTRPKGKRSQKPQGFNYTALARLNYKHTTETKESII